VERSRVKIIGAVPAKEIARLREVVETCRTPRRPAG
jgi:hypothetical protein